MYRNRSRTPTPRLALPRGLLLWLIVPLALLGSSAAVAQVSAGAAQVAPADVAAAAVASTNEPSGTGGELSTPPAQVPSAETAAIPTPAALPAPGAETSPAPEATAELAAQTDAAKAAESAPVQLHGTTVFVLKSAIAEKSVGRRAREASEALSRAVHVALPELVRVVHEHDVATIFAADVPIVELYAVDAEQAGDSSLGVYAARLCELVRDALSAEQKRSAIAESVFSVSLVVLFGLIALVLLRKVRQAVERAQVFVETHPEKLNAIRLSSFEVLGKGALRGSILFALSIARWLAPVAIVYAYALVGLSLFDATRGYTEKLTGFVFNPVSQFVTRVATTLPIVVVALAAVVAVALLVRVTGLFFASVASGETELQGVPRDLARPVGVLVRSGIIVGAIVFSAPLVTGDNEGAWARTSMVTLLTLGLAATPLLASVSAGLVCIFTRGVRVGDFVEYGGNLGKVLSVSLLQLELRALDGHTIRVPHLSSLWLPAHRFGITLPCIIRLSLDSSVSVLQLESALASEIERPWSNSAITLVRVCQAESSYKLSLRVSSAEVGRSLLDGVTRALSAANIVIKEATGPSYGSELHGVSMSSEAVRLYGGRSREDT